MPKAVAQRMAEALLRTGSGKSIADLLASITATPPTSNGKAPAAPIAASAPTPAPVAPPASTPSPQPAAGVQPVAVSSQQSAAATAVEIDPYIESARCTSCNECINLNGKLFGYNASKQAEIKDADAGTFQQLVTAAERCPVGLIHPGTPRNPKEKDLAKWLKRAEPFN
jgi:pyruvate-ferredoxin/flavodoxin oxidoreductase